MSLAPVCDVDLLLGGFPEVPLAGGGGDLVPLLGFFRVIVQRQHRTVGNGNKDFITNGKGGVFLLRLRLLQHVNILRDSFGRVVELHHRRLNCDNVSLVEATPVGYQVSR